VASVIRMIDIAEKAGVSIATVGRVLQGTGRNNIRVSKQTESKVKKIAQDLNYKPNVAAQQLVGKKSKIIGVLLDPTPSPENSVRLAEMGIRARELGYHVMPLHEHADPDSISECLAEFVGRQVDGLICLHHYYPAQPDLVPQSIAKSGLQNVLYINQPTSVDATSIGLDIADCTRQLVRHFIDHGHKRIGFVIKQWDLVWFSGPRLKQGFLDEMKAQGLDDGSDLVWVCRESSKTDFEAKALSQDALNKIVDDLVINRKVNGIIAANDHYAAQIMNCIVERGYRVPEDVAIAGTGNFDVGKYTRPTLTSMDECYAEIAHAAVDRMIGLIENKGNTEASPHTMIKPKIVIRKST
jgi:DNA-binding LacI/PurR family transcriptional regulator